MSSWKIQVYTGNGKGKTTCSIGLIIRALGAGLSCALIQFDKGFQDEEHYCERNVLRQLRGIDLFPTGCERVRPGEKFRFGVSLEDIEEAKRGLSIIKTIILEKKYQLVVCDEIISTIAYHLLKESDVLGIIDLYEQEGRPFELILTGRKASTAIISKADLVTEMNPIKHYFDEGLFARKGIEY